MSKARRPARTLTPPCVEGPSAGQDIMNGRAVRDGYCEARRLVSAGVLNAHSEGFREVQLGSPFPPFPALQLNSTRFEAVMRWAGQFPRQMCPPPICHRRSGYSFLGSLRKGSLDGTRRLRLPNKAASAQGADKTQDRRPPLRTHSA